VLNATAAIAVGIGLDIEVDQIRAALENFRGVDRRFQMRGVAGGVTVIDDYGHHPTEVRATLAAARECRFRKVHVVFQPHRYTRTQLLMDEFANAFHDADTLFVLDIYAASEPPIEGITGETLARRIEDAGKQEARYAHSFAAAAEAVVAQAQQGDMILTLGAGSVSQLGPMILEKLQAKEQMISITREVVATTSPE
jgi:UDP-N-acetylmuramate--alanine ligase